MFNRIRDAAFGISALVLAGLPAQAAPSFSSAGVLSNSTNLEFFITDASCTACSTAIEVVPYLDNAFLIRNASTAEPLVAAGDDLSIAIYVVVYNGFNLKQWMTQMVDTVNGSLGENITDEDVNPALGLGFVSVAGTQLGVISWGYSTNAISGEKDINGLAGSIGGVIQGVVPVVPAPASLAVFAAGLFGLFGLRRRAKA
jgi:hypothetical protein